MHRGLLFCLLLVLGSASTALAQEAEAPKLHTSPTPAWLPRGAYLGTYTRGGAVVPQVRLQWQLTMFQDRRDALVFLVEGGLGRAVALPDIQIFGGPTVPFKSFYSHTAMAGAGYRNQNPSGWHWGFQVTTGPVWFGSRFEGFANEDHVGGLIEGRVHVGRQLDKVALGLSVGYGEAFGVGRRNLSRNYLGGMLLGFFADWR